ncbi:hypothetical protein ACOME3_009705 [Neoechinorhynchus agilis]
MDSLVCNNQDGSLRSLTDKQISSFISYFKCTPSSKQTEIIEMLIQCLDHRQEIAIHSYLEPKLRTDVITELSNKGLGHLVHDIFSNLDPQSLFAAQQVSIPWRCAIDYNDLWKEFLVKRMDEDDVFCSVVTQDLDFNNCQDYKFI